MDPRPPNLVIVGAGTSRQGTGPWIARHAHAAGARIRGVVGRDANSAAQAAAGLRERFGIDTAPLPDLTSIVDRPDLVVIASPAPTHAIYLDTCLDRGWDVLCEKPFVWDSADDNVATASRLADALAASDSRLWLMTQWSESLEAFRLIYPDVDLTELTSFEWEMAPSSTGPDMIIDALPHAIDMLLTLAPGGEFIEPCLLWDGDDHLVITGRWGSTRVRITLTSTAEQPRPFAYALNGRRVERQIDMADYAPSFRAQGGIFPINDPMVSRILKILPQISSDRDNGPIEPTPPDHLRCHTETLDQIMKAAS